MWTVDYANAAAEAEVEALPDDLRLKFQRLVRVVQAQGLEALREPNAKHVEGKLWELRMSGRDGIARSLYVARSGRRVFVLRTFVKKTQKLPRREIEIALSRMTILE